MACSIRLRVLLLSILQAGLAGGKDETIYPYATVAKTCGPVDNPELVLILTEKPAKCGDKRKPSKFISIYLDRWSLPHAVKLPEQSHRTQRYEQRSANVVHDSVDTGTVTIDGAGRKGHYELTFKNGDVEAGDFQLTQCMRPVTCP
jgi:hypothetical protein